MLIKGPKWNSLLAEFFITARSTLWPSLVLLPSGCSRIDELTDICYLKNITQI